ncbi:MAG: hypothetical protein U0791_02855 [Gemmataceae bacterium]
MKFRLNVQRLEDRWNPSDLLGMEPPPPPPDPLDPNAPPAQQQPIDPAPADPGAPTPGYPGGTLAPPIIVP